MRPSVWGQRRRFSRPLGIALMFVAILLLGALIEALRPHAVPVIGRPEVVDGDTLRFGALRVRLTGLDAPELDQTCVGAGGVEWSCGMAAKDFVAALVGSAPVTCTRSGRDRYGRALANCTADGGDLGSQIVNAGWAVADGRYLGEQVTARLAGRGIWAGNFVLPAKWRRTHGTAEPGLWEWIRNWFQ